MQIMPMCHEINTVSDIAEDIIVYRHRESCRGKKSIYE